MARRPPRQLSVLCIDDEPDHADLLRYAIDEAVSGVHIKFETVCDPAEATARITAGHYDVVFLDYELGQITGLELLQSIREAGYGGPLIMLTAHGNEYIAAQVTRAGADEYVVKSDLNPERIREALDTAQERTHERNDIKGLQRRVEQLESLSRALAESNTEIAINARIDPLTAVFNRRAWEEALGTEHERSERYGHPYSVIMLDVDYFKLYNDAAGHQAGDRCLAQVAEIVRLSCRTIDVVGRYGGEEFVLLLPETDLDGAEIVACRLREAMYDAEVEHPGLPEGGRVTISVGVAMGPMPGGANEVVDKADRALYAAKSAGRNQVCLDGRTDQEPAEPVTSESESPSP